MHTLAVVRALPGFLRARKPEIVFHFPYGTFRSYYGTANRAYMRRIDAICHQHEIPCLTVMYSIDENTTADRLSRAVSCLVAGRQEGWKGPVVEPGLSRHGWPDRLHTGNHGKTLLFMAGMWEPSPGRLEHVLDVRGLGTLLEAGDRLASAGVRLCIASPLFSKERLRRAVLKHPGNTWTEGSVVFQATVRVPDAYFQAGLFVFPYRAAINQFVPTSVVESMFAGTPVVISDLPLFKRLINEGSTAFPFQAGDAGSLARVALQALGDPGMRAQVASAARTLAEANWSIEGSAKQLEAIAGARLGQSVSAGVKA